MAVDLDTCFSLIRATRPGMIERERSDFITGETINISGGWTLRP